ADLHAQQVASSPAAPSASAPNADPAPPRPAATPSKRPSDYLNDELPHWLRFSGEYRTRGESVSAIAFKPDNGDSYDLGRLRLNMSLIPMPWLKLQVQAQDAEVFGRNPVKPGAAPHEDDFNLRQAYVEVGNVESKKLGLRVGRQELFFGEQ